MKEGVVYKLALLGLTILIALQLTLIGFALAGKNVLSKSGRSQQVHSSYSSSQDFYGGIAEQTGDKENKKQLDNANHVYGGIIPHHLLVKDFIDAYFKNLPDKNYESVVIISPNHFNAGSRDILFSTADWDTPFGKLEADANLIKSAQESGFVFEEAPFSQEHGISGLVPFIKKYLPEAEIFPVIIKSGASLQEADSLADWLIKNIDADKTLVLASVDFSHYQPTIVADFHDLKSISAIESFSFSDLEKIEVDSPLSLVALQKYLSGLGAGKSELAYSSNSGRLLKQEEEQTTSHNFFYFKKGEAAGKSSLSFLFLGDLMLDRNVRARLENKKIGFLLDGLAGEEKRFFLGSDIVSANLEGAVTDGGKHYLPQNAYDFAFVPERVAELKAYGFNYFASANNHFSDQGNLGINETRDNLDRLSFYHSGAADADINENSRRDLEISGRKVAMLSFSMVYRNFDLSVAKNMVSAAAEANDLVIVNIHWGTEYEHQFSRHQQNIGRVLIDSGADAIIGHHPHVVQGMEIYKEKPIFYSLGNFIFDQYFSADTQEGLAVGLNVSETEMNIFLFPLKSALSVPTLMKGEAKNKFLEKFSAWSELDETKKSEIKLQRIKIAL